MALPIKSYQLKDYTLSQNLQQITSIFSINVFLFPETLSRYLCFIYFLAQLCISELAAIPKFVLTIF